MPLSLSSGLLAGRAPTLQLPPPGFTPLREDSILSVHEAKNPHSGRRNAKRSGAQKAGLAYERKVREWICARYGERALCSQWYYVRTRFGNRYIQPDALILSSALCAGRPEVLTIVECKVSFTSTGWWQLRELYFPALAFHFEPARVRLICVTRSMDPLVPTPEPVALLDELESYIEHKKVGVLLWRGP